VIALTNRPWKSSRHQLVARFGLSDLRVVNDFEAVAWALPQLTPADLRPVGEFVGVPAGVKIVIGPGTGLGIAALAPINGSFHVVASEGGHSAFGPQTEDEIEVFTRLMRRHGAVCAETQPKLRANPNRPPTKIPRNVMFSRLDPAMAFNKR